MIRWKKLLIVRERILVELRRKFVVEVFPKIIVESFVNDSFVQMIRIQERSNRSRTTITGDCES